MIRRLLDLSLIALILLGGLRAWQSGQQRTHLLTEQERLARITGILPIQNPSLLHVLALPTDDPMHFAWRLHTPPNYYFQVQNNRGSSSSFSMLDARDLLSQVRFRETPEGRLEIFEHLAFGSGTNDFGEPALTKLLHAHWHELQVEQLGAPEIATLQPDEYAVLLRLSLPDHLAAEARKTLKPYQQKLYVPVLFELTVGKKPAPKP